MAASFQVHVYDLKLVRELDLEIAFGVAYSFVGEEANWTAERHWDEADWNVELESGRERDADRFDRDRFLWGALQEDFDESVRREIRRFAELGIYD